MIQRCTNSSSKKWASYGARGISVCAAWSGPDGFQRFVEDMGEPPTPRHSIDRIDNEAGYTPTNCRWATSKEQTRNRRCTVSVTYNGETKPLAQWVEELGLNYKNVHRRLFARGWSIDRALSRA